MYSSSSSSDPSLLKKTLRSSAAIYMYVSDREYDYIFTFFFFQAKCKAFVE